MIDLRDIQFARAARSPRDFPRDGRPQVAFAGRSNVGKSSLINALVRRRNLARASKAPGRTREIHFYEVAQRAYFVDLPGYGYARVSKKMRRGWGRLIEAYLTDNAALRLVVLILDVRRDPNDDDLDLLAWLNAHAMPAVVVLTKCDKVSGNGFAQQRRRIVAALAEAIEMDEDPAVETLRLVRFSAKTGDGRSALADAVAASLETPPGRSAQTVRGASE